MPDRNSRYYWDANVFIALISNLNTPEAIENRDMCSRIIQQAMDGEIEILTSVLTLVEVLFPQENRAMPVPNEIRQRVRQLFDEPYVTLVALDEARASEARDLRWTHPWLKTADAVHVSSAAYARVDEMQTYDGRGKSRGILSLDNSVGRPALKIVVPHWQGNLPMFDNGP